MRYTGKLAGQMDSGEMDAFLTPGTMIGPRWEVLRIVLHPRSWRVRLMM